MNFWRKKRLIVATLALMVGCNEGIEFNSGRQVPLTSDSVPDETQRPSPPPPESPAPAPPQNIFHRVERLFAAGSIESVTLERDFGARTLTQSLQLVRAAPQSFSLNQLERPTHDETFTQGTLGTPQGEKFPLNEAGMLDLLIVIDNSSSMDEYQDKLAANFPALLSAIANTNWQIAVVTTDPDAPCLRNGGRPITRAQYDADRVTAEQDFAAAIQAGVAGNGIRESGILNAVRGMDPESVGCVGQSWLRPGSHTSVLIVTDEENCGGAANNGCKGAPDETWTYFTDNMKRMGREATKVSGLLFDERVPQPNGPCPFWGWPLPQQYWGLIAATGGTWGNICEANYRPILEQISAAIGRTIKYRFPLAGVPARGSLVVMVDDQPTEEFKLVDNVLTITKSLSLDDLWLNVRYRTDPQPITDRFPLAANADPATLHVQVNSVDAPRNSYVYDAPRAAIVFAAKPDENARVAVTYRAAGALPDTVPIAGEVDPASMRAKVDGLPQSDAVFDSVAHVVRFRDAPHDGARIEVTYQLPNDRVTNYAIDGATREDIATVTAIGLDNGAAIDVTLAGSDIVIPLREVSNGRSVAVVFSLRPAFANIRVPLVFEPRDKLDIQVAGDRGHCADKTDFQDSVITVACNSDQLDRLTVTYDHVASFSNRFKIADGSAYGATWAVMVDGLSVTDWRQDGDQLTLPWELLTPESTVVVNVSWQEQ